MNDVTPIRRKGLDHDLYPFRRLTDIDTFSLPGQHRVAFSLTLVLQRFHIDRKPPFAVPGMLDRPYPDVGNATQREIALRDGLWRLRESIDKENIPASFVVESDALDLLGDSFDLLRNASHCVVAGGRCAASLHGDHWQEDEELSVIRGTKSALEAALQRPVEGWRSPSGSQSSRTLDLVARAGFSYCGDFNNDDRPYLISTNDGSLVSVPMQHFSSDLHAVFGARQPVDIYLKSVHRGLLWLLRHSPTPVVLPLIIHPWIMGTPQRYRALRSFLRLIKDMPGVSFMNADEIASRYRQSTSMPTDS